MYTLFNAYTIHDVIELLALSVGWYYIATWLSYDERKPLLLYACSYYVITIASAWTGCAVLYNALIIAAPVCAVCLLLVHEKTLQKNGIGMLRVIDTSATAHDWVEHVIQHGLQCMARLHDITIVIQRNDAVSAYATPAASLYAPCSSALLELTSVAKTGASSLIITAQGTIIGHTIQWRDNTETTARMCTAQTDALVLISDSAHARWTLFSGNTLYTHLTSAQLRNALQRTATSQTVGPVYESTKSHSSSARA